MTDQTESNQNDKDGVSFWWWLLLFPIVIVILSGYWWYVVENYSSPESRGQFGDMFGGANALFSAFAFVGLIIAILLQRKELALQRDELRSTRKEMKQSRKEYEKSSKAQETQAQAFILKEVFNSVRDNDKAIKQVIKDENKLRNISSIQDYNQIYQSDEGLILDLQDVISCYHYIGFLIYSGLLTDKISYYEEAGVTVQLLWDILESVLVFEKKNRQNDFYGQYFEYLVEDILKKTAV